MRDWAFKEPLSGRGQTDFGDLNAAGLSGSYRTYTPAAAPASGEYPHLYPVSQRGFRALRRGRSSATASLGSSGHECLG